MRKALAREDAIRRILVPLACQLVLGYGFNKMKNAVSGGASEGCDSELVSLWAHDVSERQALLSQMSTIPVQLC